VENLAGYPCAVYGCSRTDAGVHATNYVAHVDIARQERKRERRRELPASEAESETQTGAEEPVRPPFFAPGEVQNALNVRLRRLPVQVVDTAICPADFDARRDALGKTYCYTVIAGSRANRAGPLAWSDRAWVMTRPLDVDLMRECAPVLVGEHDFSSFRGSKCTASSPIRSVDSIKISQLELEADHMMIPPEFAASGLQLIQIRIRGPRFLYNQVRVMASTLVACGRGQLDRMQLEAVLQAQNRAMAPMTAPSHGLCLEQVHYQPGCIDC
jgi:tRNA pseudouridine38-40 synthase